MNLTTPPAPAQNSEICDLPARRLAALIKAGQLSSREVMTAFLKQIDDLNPRFNAIVSRVPHAALLAQADAADQAIAARRPSAHCMDYRWRSKIPPIPRAS